MRDEALFINGVYDGVMKEIFRFRRSCRSALCICSIREVPSCGSVIIRQR
jgi:hypothetical protein